MVGGFLKAFKSETRRIMLTQNSNLNFSEIKRLTPSDLAKVVAEEEATKKSASKQRKGQKSKKKLPLRSHLLSVLWIRVFNLRE